MPTQPLIVYGDYGSVASPEVRLFHPDTGVQQVTASLSTYGDMEAAFSASIDTTYTGVYPFEVWASGGSAAIGYGFAPLDDTTSVKHATSTKDEAETALNNAVLDALDLMIENDSGWKFNSHAISEAGGGGGSAPTADQIRDAILDRVLNGSHDVPGSPGKLLQQTAAAASEKSEVRFHVHYDPEGDKLQVVCWLEINGLVADLSSDASVELDLSITEFGAATPLVEFDADSTDLEGDKFQLEQLEPNPSAGRAYDLVATLTFDGTAYAGGSAFSIWGS
jgi:hypothetical protein